MLKGLYDAGVDLTQADLFVGTSAGSVVSAKVASGMRLERLFEEQVDARLQVPEPKPQFDFERLRREITKAKEGEGDAREVLKRVGTLALSAETVSERERRRAIAARLSDASWPSRGELRIVAVDVHSGTRTVFDARSDVDLVDAVAASCAVPGVWPPVTIGANRYMDGGAYSSDNADLAVRHDRVLVLALRPRGPRLGVVSLEEGLEALRANGSEVTVVHPDEATEQVIDSVGGNLLDSSVRGAAARAGRDQGRGLGRPAHSGRAIIQNVSKTT
jgi:NTE family protein